MDLLEFQEAQQKVRKTLRLLSPAYYASNGIVVADGLRNNSSDEEVEFNLIFIMVCVRGYAALNLNGKKRQIRRGDIIISPPVVHIGGYKGSKDLDVKILAISQTDIKYSFNSGSNIWTVMTYARTNPVFHLSDQELDLTLAYYNVIRKKLNMKKTPYYAEIVQSLLQCAFLEICVIINMGIVPGGSSIVANRHDLVFKQFMELLADSDCRDRTVAGYASRLCITPKYLSSVCLEITGKTALALILENATYSIERSLLYSQETIKEIAARYSFPDVSSFGKFVRSRLGSSPREYRRKHAENMKR